MTEPHHPSWAWRHELWLLAGVVFVGTVVAATRDPRPTGIVIALATATAAFAVLLCTTYVREAGRLQRELDQETTVAEARDTWG